MPSLRFLPTTFRSSLPLIVVCAAVFASLLIARVSIDRPEKAERNIQKRQAEGKVISPEAYVPVWLYKGLELNVFLAAALLLASPWLGRGRGESPLLSEPAKKPLGVMGVGLVVVVMGVAAWHHAPRLTKGMWGDEEFNASRFILPSAKRADDGTIKMEDRTWTTTLWNMRKPTNHLGYSVFARLSHDTFFKPTTGPKDPWFSEAWLRAPVFVAGLLLIPAFVWALRVWGLNPWWALVMMLFHPWILRFGVDGRGYGFLMLAGVLILGVVGRALQTGKWVWWALLSFLGFFLVWSNLQGVYTLAGVHLMVLAGLLNPALKWPAKLHLGSRWIVSGVFTLMLIIGYLAPCWPQLQEFMAKREIAGSLDARFWLDGICAWFFGQAWVPWLQPDNPLRYAMELSMQKLPLLHWVGIVSIVAAALFGAVIVLVRKAWWPLAAFALLSPLAMLAHMFVSENRPYDWYFSSFVPGLFLLVAVCFTLLQRWKVASVAVAIILTGLYAFITREPRGFLRDNDIEPSRASVASYREVTNPRHPDIDKEVISGAFTMYTEGYDPALRRFSDVPGLYALMEEADRTGKQLYINVGYLKFLRDSPGTSAITAVLEDTKLFENSGRFYGLLPYTTRDVFHYLGRSHPATTAPVGQ